MTFRVIKFCKHSPGGLTVISNLFSCYFPPFTISPTHLLTFTLCSASILCLSTPYSICSFSFFSFSSFISAWPSIVTFLLSHANRYVWNCSLRVGFCYIKPSHRLIPESTTLFPLSSSTLFYASALTMFSLPYFVPSFTFVFFCNTVVYPQCWWKLLLSLHILVIDPDVLFIPLLIYWLRDLSMLVQCLLMSISSTAHTHSIHAWIVSKECN